MGGGAVRVSSGIFNQSAKHGVAQILIDIHAAGIFQRVTFRVPLHRKGEQAVAMLYCLYDTVGRIGRYRQPLAQLLRIYGLVVRRSDQIDRGVSDDIVQPFRTGEYANVIS